MITFKKARVIVILIAFKRKLLLFSHPQSLHYLSPDGSNQYTQAIQAVGEIIEPYDADKQFPALGFGARIPPHGQVSFEFFLNLTSNPYCNGVQGILQAYRTALNQVSRCTYFFLEFIVIPKLS